jgi:PST family polysaccharide transporter
MIASRLVTRSIDLATLLVLGRLLSPADFGLVAIAMSVLVIVETVSEMPVAQVLIRVPILSKSLCDTTFTIGTLRAVALGMFLCAVAWPLARFYNDYRLTALLCTLWIAPAVRSLGSPLFVEYFRRFDFRPLLAIEIVGKVLAFLISVSLAGWTASYWSIAAGTIVAPIGMSAMTYLVAPYRPRFSLAAWREFSGFFGWSTASQLVNAINGQLDQLILARFVTPNELGRFSMANNLANLPQQIVVVQSVTPLVVAFSHIAGERQRLANAYTTSTVTMAAIGLPIMVALSMLAEPVVDVVLGRHWLGASAMLRWLSVAAIPSLFVSALPPLTLALGRTRIFLQLSTVELFARLPLTLPAVIYFGVSGVIAARLGLALVMAVCSMMAVRALIRLPLRSQLASPWRPIISVIGMALTIRLFEGWLATLRDLVPLALGLAGVIAIAVAVYSVLLFSFWQIAGRPVGFEAKAAEFLIKYARRLMPTRKRYSS